ncbi:hypothetical protein JTE90_011562 [Oedothorax gibbosus]|uniref:Uncharacterized protein n=1 Tax=Oedothorax gibbosus TaxID=931172 RepID=A0AAV6UMK5_9ARAC|nr:hypothetical protein JTE90_011562 [Oedothorax gibbosus]
MLQTRLVKYFQLASNNTPRSMTDDHKEITYPRAGVLRPTLFSRTSTPDSDDPYDAKFSTLNHQIKSSFSETGNTETRFFWMIDMMSFRQLFHVYSKFGDSNRTGESITLTSSDKWLRQAKIVDNRRVSTTDTGIYFKQIAKFKKSLNFNSYQTFLELLAKKKNLNLSEMKYKMVTCGPPPTYKTTEVDNRRSSYVIEQPKYQRCKKKETVRLRYEGFFSNCQCQHGYNSQISYGIPDNLPIPASENLADEDWFPEE